MFSNQSIKYSVDPWSQNSVQFILQRTVGQMYKFCNPEMNKMQLKLEIDTTTEAILM